MPFTGSHPAAVLPFLRTGLVPAALVIGSMVPDLPYYVPIPADRPLTHSALGVVTVDLLMALGCFVLWVWLLAPAFVAIAGNQLRRRLPPGAPEPLRRYVSIRVLGVVALSCAVGAASHVLWDAFTHSGTWGPEHIEWLRKRQGVLRGYRWAQYVSGLVGLVALSWVFVRWWSRTAPGDGTAPEHSTGCRRSPGLAASPALAATVWSAIAGALVLGAVIGAWWGMHEADGGGLRRAAFRAATVGGAAPAAVALVWALIWSAGREKLGRSPAGPPS